MVLFSAENRGGAPVFHFWPHRTTEDSNIVSFFSFARLNVINWWSDATQTAHFGHLSLRASRMWQSQKRSWAVTTLPQIYLNLMKGLLSCSYMHRTLSTARTGAPMQDDMQSEHERQNSDAQLAKNVIPCVMRRTKSCLTRLIHTIKCNWRHCWFEWPWRPLCQTVEALVIMSACLTLDIAQAFVYFIFIIIIVGITVFI